MDFLSKIGRSTQSVHPSGKNRRRQRWRRLTSAALCVALLSTNTVGALAVETSTPETSVVMEENGQNTAVSAKTTAQSDTTDQKTTTASPDTTKKEETDTSTNTTDKKEIDKSTDDTDKKETDTSTDTTDKKETDTSTDDADKKETDTSTDTTDKKETDTSTDTTDKKETDTSTDDADKKETDKSDDDTDQAKDSYTLHLTHVFRFTVDGKKVSVQESEDLKLTEADFTNGKCDLKQFAKDEEQLEVTKAGSVSIEDFDENGVHKFGAQILYAVSDGWRVVRKANATRDAVSLRSVFEGSTSGDYTFVPADVVRLKLKYEYSKTGGLAGMNVASPATVEAEPEKQTGGTYKVTYTLPTKDGFRIVLNPAPLNEYLKRPPTGNETAAELKAALERGDFDVDIANHTVYYYQQSPGNDTNPTYGNRYSDKYNGAWNSARTLKASGYTATAVGENANPGASALTNPKLEVTLTENQLKTAQAGDGLDITVYYRRNATWYTVNHWVPKALAGTLTGNEETKTVAGAEYVRLDQETLQGRVGATTRAAAKTDGVYEQLQSTGYSQKLIESTNTEVDIYYAAANSYRVIFDTDYTYIPRQQVKTGDSVDFTNIAAPTRTGYEFAGWQYLKKGATPDANGNYADTDYEDAGTKDDPALTIDYDLIGKAMLQNSGGVLALHLYPKWTPDTTQVRVVLWTENLTGKDDVQATADGGNATYYNTKYASYSAVPVTHEPQLETSDSYYSNAGSFTVDVNTDSSLLETDNSDELLSSIQSEVTSKFKEKMGQSSGIDVANFYTQAAFEIVHEEGDEINYNATTASADGKTMIYVYFTRNIYELLFTYYGSATVGGNASDYCVAISTNGYSFSSGAAVPNGNLNFGYSTSHDGGNGSNYNNGWMRADVTSGTDMPVPQTITIRAKYGADLRDVWPVARSEEQVDSLDNSGNRGNTAKMISWGTTDGKYCEGGFFNSGLYNAGEPTIMGTYAAMSAEIVADPTQPVTYNNGNVDSGLRHNLVAYWFNGAISHYRNNHCYEVPELEITNDMTRVSISNTGDTTNARNVLYLVPTDNAALAKYEFNDLMRVSYNDGQITYDDPNGTYYAVRAYTNNGETKYYAVARQVDTVSSNAINKQNPSARLHMTRANTTADHSTQYEDGDGAYNGTTCGTEGNPYDLYFYYNRDRYTITYMAPSDNITTATEHTLGTIELPYGAMVTEEKYGFKLDYQDKNTDNKYGWIPADETSVCPDRAENGTAKWTFKGWGLGPAGVNMQWTVNQDTEAEAQAGDDFAIEGNLRLYAIWDAPTYTVTFHLNGGTGDLGLGTANIVVNVPANTRYSANGRIPRPVRGGYTLDGWYVADENGNITQPETGFDFDQTIAENKHVAAKWSAVSTEKFSYTVYYVTDKPNAADESKTTVKIKDDAIVSDDTTGGTTYYVLGKTEHKDQMFIANATLNETATLQDGYIPQETNKILTLDNDPPQDTQNVIFYYDPITAGKHAVHFVLAGTEKDMNPTLVKSYEVEADQTVVTPKSDAAKELTDMGYALVNRNDDGNTYTTVDKAADLKWYDTNGDAQSIDTLTGAAIPDTIVYLVQPIPYTITYRNAAGSPNAANDALNAVTALNTSVEDVAQGKNPTKYTTTDNFTATNPARVYNDTDKKWYEFSHWSLGNGTTLKTGDQPGSTLTVSAGTVGNLTFVANWRAADTGSLTVSKTVAGTAGETDKEFEFTVTLKNTDDTALTGDYSYTGTGTDAPNGTLTLTNGAGTVTLKHGQSITISGIPADTKYTVTETEANQDGYTTTSTGATGTITKDTTATAAFTNTKNAPPAPDTGNLTVSKTVAGTAGETDKEFEFTVTLKNTDDTALTGDYSYTGTGTDAPNGTLTLTNGAGTVRLKHGQSITISGIPADTKYTVTETEANQDGYTTTKTGDTGTIAKDTTATAAFTNTKNAPPAPDTGSLTVSKTVAGTAGETDKEFEFTVTLKNTDDTALTGDYSYTGTGTDAPNGTLTLTNGAGTVTLKHGQSITITGLPVGTTYEVAETKAEGYTTTKNGDTGTITKDTTATAAFTNTKNTTPPDPDPGTGNLTVSKTVTGNAGDTNKDFNFTVTLDDTTISNTYGDMTFTDGVATFKLKHNESKTAANLPAGTGYTVTETEAGKDGYTTTAENETGTITKGTTVTAKFTNSKSSTPVNPDPDPKPIQKTGNLTVSKTVAGDAGETNRAFTFKVTLDNASINGKYGDMTFTNGVATITLKHGESKTATGLPDGKSYTVTETEANQDGYVTTKIGDTGTIRDGITATAAFTNTKNATPPEPGTGNLIVSKVVAGNAGDKTKDFQFTVTLGDKAINGKYGDMTFTNGVATITLKHGESKTATGLPVDTTYKVVETKANQDGYTTVATGSSGTITKAGATAAFTNTKAKSTDPSKPTKPTKPTNPGTPANPSKRPIDGAPNTGDESNLSLWLMLMGASCIGVISTLLFSRKRKKREGHNK